MYQTLSGQLAAYKSLEVLANNLANMTTTGYRSENLLFEKALDKKQNLLATGGTRSDIQKPSALDSQDFVGIRGSYTDMTQGPIEITGNSLDVAMTKSGFFVVNVDGQERLTRAGNFRLDENKRIVTSDGHPVQGSGGDIIINGSRIQISDQADILVDGQSIGKFRVVDAASKDLEREAAMRFKLKDGVVASAVNSPEVKGGALESSNVNPVRDLTQIIMVSRLFESHQKVREEGSRMNELLNTRVGSTAG